MRTIKKTVYKFDELSEDAQKQAIQNLWDINVTHEWWDFTYADAEEIGLKINGFDIGRASYVDAEFLWFADDVAKTIIENHGEQCETYKDAQCFLDEYKTLKEQFKDDEWMFDQEVEELSDLFLKQLQEDYRIMLRNEYEYLTSKEAIVETIEANEYEFYENGEFF